MSSEARSGAPPRPTVARATQSVDPCPLAGCTGVLGAERRTCVETTVRTCAKCTAEVCRRDDCVHDYELERLRAALEEIEAVALHADAEHARTQAWLIACRGLRRADARTM
jgi:hypothetical protein